MSKVSCLKAVAAVSIYGLLTSGHHALIRHGGFVFKENFMNNRDKKEIGFAELAGIIDETKPPADSEEWNIPASEELAKKAGNIKNYQTIH